MLQVAMFWSHSAISSEITAR